MDIKLHKISDFERRIKFSDLLEDAYSWLDRDILDNAIKGWREIDNFIYDYVGLETADTCSVITTLNDDIVGFIMWDPRNLPEYAIIGHNCIITKHKGKGYGKLQLQEAINKITRNGGKKVFVSTGNGDGFIPARRMYESVGFIKLDNSTLQPWQIAEKQDTYYSMDMRP